MHSIITGGAGFIGSSIAKRLVQDGHEVTVIDNFSTSVTDDVEGATLIDGDLLNSEAAAGLDIEECDSVFHLAGPSSGPAANNDPVGTVTRGYQITHNVLNLGKRLNAKRILNASSMVVYGNFDTNLNPVAEDFPCLPIAHYAVGKYANERLVEIFCRQHGIGFNQMRQFNVYGPGQDLSRMDQGVVSIFLSMLMKSPKIVSKGPIERFRDLVHIDDVVEAWIACAIKGSIDGPINIGSGVPMTYGDLMHLIADELGIVDQLKIEIVDGTPGDLYGIYADIGKLKSVLGHSPRIDPVAGVRDYTRWASSVG